MRAEGTSIRPLRAWRPALSLAAALALPCLARAALGPADLLRAVGPVLEDRQGRVVTLHGTNLGGWLVQEDWMSPNGYGALPHDRWQARADAGTLTIDLGEWSTFGRVVLPSAEVTIEAAPDGRTWTPVRVRRSTPLAAASLLELDRGYTARWLRLRRHDGARLPLTDVQLQQNDDYSVRLALRARFGAATADRLILGYQRTWLTAADLDRLHGWGLNLVRVPMNWLDFMTPEGAWKPDAFARLDWLVAACAARDLYVILDLHAVPGGASPWASSGRAGDDGTGQNPNGFWTDPAFAARTAEIWRRLSAPPRGHPAVAGYDLVNEPLYRFDERPRPGETSSAAVLAKAACLDRLYRAVRAVDPDHIVVLAAYTVAPPGGSDYIGTPSGFLAIPPPAERGWTNVVYQTHHYDMLHPRDHAAQARLAADALADIARHQREWNVPVYAGEYTFYGFYDVWADWMRGLDRLHVSWSNWTYKIRGSADDPAGADWGFFHTNRHPVPDVNRDSAAAIAAQWAEFGTEQFQRNDRLIEVVRRGASAP